MKNFSKQIVLFLFLALFNTQIQAQDKLDIPETFPTNYQNSFTFPLMTKIVLELKETKDRKYRYKVLSMEPVEEYYSLSKKENMFSKSPKKNTVELFIVGAYYNEGKNDKDWKTVLLIRNNLKKDITYKADIKYYYSDTFENTSIVGAFSGTFTTELWHHKIDYVTIYDFEELKF